jgi:hypothetical protein
VGDLESSPKTDDPEIRRGTLEEGQNTMARLLRGCDRVTIAKVREIYCLLDTFTCVVCAAEGGAGPKGS